MTNIVNPNNAGQSIGDIISSDKNLTDEQIGRIIEHQRQNGTRFGESAVALGLASGPDVLWALSRQFNYPYAKLTDDLGRDLVVAHKPFEPASEFFREMRSKLIAEGFFSQDRTKSIAICSADSGDGRTYIAANLAVVLSQLGGRTLLIDADMRSPRLHNMMGVGKTFGGLSGVLSARNEANVIRPIDSLPSLFLLPVGVVPPNPLELLQGLNFDLLLKELASKFDHIVIDTPASSMGADSYVVASKCKAALVIARRGVTAFRSIETLSNQLSRIPDILLAKMMNERG